MGGVDRLVARSQPATGVGCPGPSRGPGHHSFWVIKIWAIYPLTLLAFPLMLSEIPGKPRPSTRLLHLGRNLPQLGQHAAQRHRRGVARAQGKVDIAIVPVKPLVDRRRFRVGLDRAQGQADRGLRLFNGLVGSSRQQREDSRAQAGGNPRRHQHRLVAARWRRRG